MASRTRKPKRLAAHDRGARANSAAAPSLTFNPRAFRPAPSHLTGPAESAFLSETPPAALDLSFARRGSEVDQVPFDPHIGSVRSNTESAESSCGSHQLKSMAACPRHFDLRYVRKLKPAVEKPWFLAGTMFHACTAYHYGEMLPTWPDFMSVPLTERLASLAKGSGRKIQETLQLYWFYRERFSTERVTPIAVEYEYRAPIGLIDPGGPRPDLDGFEVTCGTDLLLEENGLRLIDDYKTTMGEPGKTHLPRWTGGLEHTWQAAFNVLIVEAATQVPVDGFRIRRIKKTIPYEADINPVAITRLALDEHRRAIRDVVIRRDTALRVIQDKPDELLPPQSSACMSKYGLCEYAAICFAPDRDARRSVITQAFVQDPTGVQVPDCPPPPRETQLDGNAAST